MPELWSSTQTPVPVKKSLLDECEITEQTEIAPQIPVITIDGKNYLMKGDFAIITGEKKSGKSHVLRRVIKTGYYDCHNERYSARCRLPARAYSVQR